MNDRKYIYSNYNLCRTVQFELKIIQSETIMLYSFLKYRIHNLKFK